MTDYRIGYYIVRGGGHHNEAGRVTVASFRDGMDTHFVVRRAVLGMRCMRENRPW